MATDETDSPKLKSLLALAGPTHDASRRDVLRLLAGAGLLRFVPLGESRRASGTATS
jgi:hypothetical protein